MKKQTVARLERQQLTTLQARLHLSCHVSISCAAGNQRLSDLHVLRHMTSLRNLNLSQTDTSDAGLFRIAAMSQLTRLSLRDTSVTANAFRALAALDSLQSLDLSHTAIHHSLRNLGAPGSTSILTQGRCWISCPLACLTLTACIVSVRVENDILHGF